MFRTLSIAVLASGASLAFVSQSPPPSKNPPAQEGKPVTDRTKPSTSREVQESDGYFAKWLAVHDSNEVEIAEIATQRATDPDVKRFAHKLADGHRELMQKLEPFSSAAGRSAVEAGSPQRSDTQRPATSQPAGKELDHVALIEELGQQCLKTARTELEQKQGAEFDRCFMAMAIASHSMSNDMRIVFRKHVSAPLETVLNEGQASVTNHLQEAKRISQMLERKATSAPKVENK